MKNKFIVWQEMFFYILLRLYYLFKNFIPRLKRRIIRAVKISQLQVRGYLPYLKIFKNKWIIIWGCGCVVVVATAIYLLNLTTNYYLVSYNGINLGYARNKGVVNDAFSELKASFAYNSEVLDDIANFHVSEIQSSNWFMVCLDKGKFKDVIVSASESMDICYSVFIDGERKCSIRSESKLNNAFTDYKDDRITLSKDIAERYDSCTVKIKQDVKIVKEYCAKDDISYDLGYDTAYDVFVENLNYTIECIQTMNESIPYITYYERNPDLPSGAKYLVDKGANGVKQVKYNVIVQDGLLIKNSVLEETVIKSATSRKIQIGSGYSGGLDSHVNLQFPVDGYITSSFGDRDDPFTGNFALHNGLDIGAVTGTPIYAASSGKVIQASNSGNGYGNCVVIEHSSGFKTLYAHCSKLLVEVGQYVDAGQNIALVGSTGRSTGPHLHFSIIIDGKYVDPSLYF